MQQFWLIKNLKSEKEPESQKKDKLEPKVNK